MSNIETIARIAIGAFEKHQLAIRFESGAYRHLRFAKPNSGHHAFDLHTAPGLLTVVGDVGGPWSMRAGGDMLKLIRETSGSGINPHYWGEKIRGGRDRLMTYSTDVFRQALVNELAEADEYNFDARSEAVVTALKALANGECETAYDARHYLTLGEKSGAWTDTWEWDLRDWDTDWLWACHATLAGVRIYDAAKGDA